MCQGYKGNRVKTIKVLDAKTIKVLDVLPPELKQKATVLKNVVSQRTIPCSESSLSDRIKGRKSCLKVRTQSESLRKQASSFSLLEEDKDKNVRFSTVEMRLYPLRLGDNPSISGGPPLTIGWDYEGSPIVSKVEEYETIRPPRRTSEEMKIPRSLRQEWLREEGYSRREMNEAQARALRAKRGRLASARETDSLRHFEEGKEFLHRKFKKWILHAPSDNELYKKWQEQQSCSSKEDPSRIYQLISCST